MTIGRRKHVPTNVDGNPISGKGSDSQYQRRTEAIREHQSSFTEEEEEEENELTAQIEDLRLEDTKADRFDGQGLLLTIEARLFRMENKLDILAAGGRSSLLKVKSEVNLALCYQVAQSSRSVAVRRLVVALISCLASADEFNTTLEEEADLREAEEANRRETELNRAYKCHTTAEKEVAAAEAEYCETMAEQNWLGQSAKLALSHDSSVFRDYLNATARLSLLKDNMGRLWKKTQKAGAGLFVLEAEDEDDGAVDGAPAVDTTPPVTSPNPAQKKNTPMREDRAAAEEDLALQDGAPAMDGAPAVDAAPPVAQVTPQKPAKKKKMTMMRKQCTAEGVGDDDDDDLLLQDELANTLDKVVDVFSVPRPGAVGTCVAQKRRNDNRNANVDELPPKR
ncbi:hypothetical protein M885DRAFT_571942 [Pelagophyceae sp. CCMP2097]|nr:hypothetical protein M885DRAFT_571942 [Pelagophyceae sp. CCMP2097]